MHERSHFITVFRAFFDTITLQVRFINFIPMQFFHKSLHTCTPLCISTSAARYLMSKILTITAGIKQHSMLNLPVKAIAENIEQQNCCGRMNLSLIYRCMRTCIEIIYAVYRPLQKLYN